MLDQTLLSRIAGRDEAALKQLYDRYYERLGRFLLRFTNDPELAAEVINDVFLVVWRSAAGFRGDSAPSTWIMGIAHNKMLKALKRRRPMISLEAIADTIPDPVESAHQRGRDLMQSVAKLNPIHKAVVVLTYQFGYSYKEIGRILNCPENTVKTRMFHARRALRKLLERSQ